MLIAINCAGKRIVCADGVRFVSLPGARPADVETKQAIAKAAMSGFSAYASLSLNKEIPLTAAGIYKARDVKQIKKGMLSLSSLFSAYCVRRNVMDAMLLLRLPGDAAVLIGVRQGVPFTENAGSANDIAQIVDSVFVMYTAGCVVFGDAELFVGGSVVGLDMETIADKATADDLARAAIVFYGTSSLIKIGAVLAVVAGVAGYYYMDSVAKADIIRKRAAQAAAEKKKNNPVNVFRQLQQDALGREAGYCTETDVRGMTEAIAKIPFRVGGWVMTGSELQCAADGKRVTLLSWKRDGGTNEVLASAFQAVNILFKEDLRSAEMRFDAIKSPELTQQAMLDADKLPTFNEFMIRYGSLFQRISKAGVQVTIANMTPIAGQLAPLEFTENQFLKGRLTISGDAAFFLPALARVGEVARFEKVSFDSSKDDKTVFTVEGSYYAKTVNPAAQ